MSVIIYHCTVMCVCLCYIVYQYFFLLKVYGHITVIMRGDEKRSYIFSSSNPSAFLQSQWQITQAYTVWSVFAELIFVACCGGSLWWEREPMPGMHRTLLILCIVCRVSWCLFIMSQVCSCNTLECVRSWSTGSFYVLCMILESESYVV